MRFTVSRLRRPVASLLPALALLAAPAQAGPLEDAADALNAAAKMVRFEAPVAGFRINSVFGFRKLPGQKGRMHEGIDIAAPTGTPVLAAARGEVARTGACAGYGKFVEVRHPNGVTSLYAHLSKLAPGLRVGDRVVAGQKLGAVGATGRVTGPHLHFEIRQAGRAVDPETFLGRGFAAVEVPGAVERESGLTHASVSLTSASAHWHGGSPTTTLR
jgi:murein DD-endopeptidase MepM/ murein hydrolase activator NlpD